MAWYRTGLITVTNGQTLVTGSGTDFVSNARAGYALQAPDGRSYEIAAVVSATQITLASAYLGSTSGGQAYAIMPTQSFVADLATGVTSLINSFAAVRDGVGAGLHPDGTLSLPAIRFAADQDTGIRRFDANSFALVCGASDRLVANSNGVAIVQGAVGNDGKGALLVHGVDQSTGNLTDAGAHGASIYLRDSSGAGVGVGGGVLFGSSFSNQTPFAAIKGSLSDGASNTIGDLVFSTRASVGATAMTARWILGWDGTLRPAADNSVNIGTGSSRIATVFAATGTINTSDAREKEWRGAMSAAELRAAKRIAAELGFYRWLDAVAEKGDDARLHFGARAQQVWEIMADEGLVDPIVDGLPGATPYAFLCFDGWGGTAASAPLPEVRGPDGELISPAWPGAPAQPAGNRFGLRTDQLALFLIAAQEERLAALEASV